MLNITEQTNSPKILSDNKKIKDALKTITDIQENLKELVNNQRDDSSVISNKIKTAEEEIAKNEVKINEHIELEKKIEHSVEELWKLVLRNTLYQIMPVTMSVYNISFPTQLFSTPKYSQNLEKNLSATSIILMNRYSTSVQEVKECILSGITLLQ